VGVGSANDVTASFWDTQTSGQAKSAAGAGKTAAQMQTAQTFLNAGWDFVGENANGTSQVWQMPQKGGYPVLAAFNGYTPPRLRGEGTPEDPYLISDAVDLGAIVHYSSVAHYRLGASIDLAGIHWGGAVIPGFAGTFDGDGHAISHLTMRGAGYVGLFGRLHPGAEVKNLGVVDVNMAGSGYGVGALAGSNGGSVTNCHSAGLATGWGRVGGLVGGNGGDVTQCYSTATVTGTGGLVGGLVGSNGGAVTQCYSTGTVSGKDLIGGLVGYNNGHVAHCYSAGTVSGDSGIGGLVGSNFELDFGGGARGTVIHSYSTGAVSGSGWGVGGLVGDNSWGIVTACFWDTQTSGQAQMPGSAGTGRTTVEMQTAKTFLDAGWDFVGETTNGTEDIWWILEGRDYPRLTGLPWEPGEPRRAFSPYPWDGAADVVRSPVLRWAPGEPLLRHDVYLGGNRELIANATTAALEVYRGRYAPEVTTYDPGILESGKTYYWRVDEVNEADPNSPWKGTVWSFTTADFVVVSVMDDFESYTDDEGQRIYQTWLDGLGPDANTPGNGTGSLVGSDNPPFTEQEIIHGGKQSMPMDYDNSKNPWYSEAERRWPTAQDWTIAGADTLTLYFRGKAGNGREPLYVAIEDSAGRMAVVVHPDAEAVRATQWQKWHIVLGDVRTAGVDVAAVQKMVIGVGDRKNPKPGGGGRIYIDDIRPTKRMP